MDIYDRDYMRRPDEPPLNWRFWGAVIVPVIGAILLISNLGQESPAERNRPEPLPVIFPPVEPQSATLESLVNLNTATIEELHSIPYVEKVLAKAIQAGRPYATHEDLLAVPGIKERMIEHSRPYTLVK